ncbi:MAG: stage V sporulation protein AC [Clostridia bacterium]|nr:stage V sporulation protein AC [Clostridia bacterium]
MTNKEYIDYVNKKTPNSKILKNTVLAFIIGGHICCVGQAFSDFYRIMFNLSVEDAKTAVPITMVFLGALFTGLNLYNKLARYAGAGTIVPITGFANSIVSPAMEFKREGLVLGLGAKMFTVAGPVLVYGITASVIVGLIYYFIGGMM